MLLNVKIGHQNTNDNGGDLQRHKLPKAFLWSLYKPELSNFRVAEGHTLYQLPALGHISHRPYAMGTMCHANPQDPCHTSNINSWPPIHKPPICCSHKVSASPWFNHCFVSFLAATAATQAVWVPHTSSPTSDAWWTAQAISPLREQQAYWPPPSMLPCPRDPSHCHSSRNNGEEPARREPAGCILTSHGTDVACRPSFWKPRYKPFNGIKGRHYVEWGEHFVLESFLGY